MRLTLGLLQGALLYGLYHADKHQLWPATTDSLFFTPLLMVFTILPILMISGLGHLPLKTWLRWMLAAALIAASLGVYDVWRSLGTSDWRYSGNNHAPYPSPLFGLFSVIGFYIAHALILAAATDQKRIASYPSYFDNAWKLLIQILFSGLFVGAFWLVLWLGSALFSLIGLHFLRDLIQTVSFALPVTVFAFACAMHLTDVRPAIVRGIRNLLLVLLSWILPVTVLIVGGFLLSLPFTGLAQLWATKHATTLLLSAAAALIILINTAFQNGAVAHDVARALRLSARVASFLLAPLVAIAIYALGLRVGDYGWTTDRLIAASCLLVASSYALGYAWAASRRTGWLTAVAPVNIVTAFGLLGLLLALFSPLLDPARLSVASQVARLHSGQQSASQFDFDYLLRQGQRYGVAALKQLQTSATGKEAALVQSRATQALDKKLSQDQAPTAPTRPDLLANLTPWPQGQTLPDSFMAQDWRQFKDPWRLPSCLKSRTARCDVYLIDFEGDTQPELLLVDHQPASGQAVLFTQKPGASWQVTATLAGHLATCAAVREKLQHGDYQLVTPRRKELEIAGMRIQLEDARTEPPIRCESLTNHPATSHE
jgi:hypothetical protein